MRSRHRVLIGTIAALAPLAIAHAQNSYYWSISEGCYYNQTANFDSFLSPCWNSSGPTAAPTSGYGPPTAGSDVYLVGAAEFTSFGISSDGAPASMANLVIDDIFPLSFQVSMGLDSLTPITVTGTETVGQDGAGYVFMTGSTHTAANLIVGANAGSDGNIQVHGGALSAGMLTVGSSGYGSMNQDQSYASSSVSVTGSLILGSGAGIFGNYYLSDGILSVGQEVVAQSGSGYVYQSGGNHTVGTVQLAQNAGSQGQFSFVGGTLTVNGDVVGGAGTSLLEIDAPGASFSGNISGITNLSVGSATGSNGVFATGGSQSVAAQVELIGDEGTGTWTQSGGTNSAGTLALGEIAGGNGTYNLSGGSVSADFLQVGVNGIGTFNQYAGTSIIVNNEFDVALFSGSSGTYNLYGGSLSAPLELIGQSAPMAAPAAFVQRGGTNTADSIQLGDLGVYQLFGGQLHVTDNLVGNGELEIGGGSLSAGAAVSVGTLMLDAGSSYETNTELDVSSTALPSVIAGALTVDSVGSFNVYGTAELSGTGGLTNNGTLSIGSPISSAPAQLLVNDNAQLQNNGTLQLTGAGALLVHSGTVTNAASGNMVMTVQSSPQVSVDGSGAFINQGTVSQFSGDVSVTVTDPSLTPTITNQGNWTLNAPATLTVQSGQFINAAGATFNNTGGTVTVAAGGSLVNPGQFFNGGTVHVLAAGQVVSDGVFTNSATVTIDSGASFSGAGTYTQTSGLTKVYGTLSMPTIYNQGGSFGGSGTVNGSALDPSAPPVDFYNDGGTIAPGDPSLLTINGNLHFSSGLLDIKIAGLNNLDQLAVTGLAEFTGGTLELDFIDGFVPHTGDAFYFLLNDDLSALNFSNVTYTGLPTGFQFDLASDGSGLDLETLNDGAAPVPVPASVWMLGLGLTLLGGMAARGRRRPPRLTLPAAAGTAPRFPGTAGFADWMPVAHGSAGNS
jgi:hypothetical protein